MPPLFAHIPAPAHGPDATTRAPGNTGHRRGIEAQATWRTAGRVDPSARAQVRRAAACGRFPGTPASTLMEPAPRLPEAPHPRPTRARGHEHRPEGGLQTACLRGDRVHPTVQLGGPVFRRGSWPPADATGRGGGHSCRPTGWCGHVAPLPTLEMGWMPPCLHHHSRVHARGRHRPAPPCGALAKAGSGRAERHYRPCHRTAAVTRPQLLRAPPRARGGMPHLTGRELPP